MCLEMNCLDTFSAKATKPDVKSLKQQLFKSPCRYPKMGAIMDILLPWLYQPVQKNVAHYTVTVLLRSYSKFLVETWLFGDEFYFKSFIAQFISMSYPYFSTVKLFTRSRFWRSIFGHRSLICLRLCTAPILYGFSKVRTSEMVPQKFQYQPN